MLQLGKRELNFTFIKTNNTREREKRERESFDEGIFNQSIHSQTNKQKT
jgi:hypothetical protein